MQRLERLFAISEIIRRSSPRPVSASSLAERFEVSRRTIERDLSALRHAGVPLYAERGRSGGHVAIDNQRSAIVSLSVAEITSLIAAVHIAGSDAPWSHAGQVAMSKLLDGLMPETRSAVEQLRSTIQVRCRVAQPLAKRTMRTLEAGVQQRRAVNLDYEDQDGAKTTRTVDAVGFYEGTESWFLIAWCHTRQDGRIFRTDRIRGARSTSRTHLRTYDTSEVLGWVPHEVGIPLR